MMTPREDGELLFERDWSEPNGRFRIFIDANRFAVIRFFGKGSMDGTRAFIQTLDEAHEMVADALDVRGMVDLRELDGAPVRAQLLLGKWLLNNKGHFHRIAVFGGKKWEMQLARAVGKIARFKNIGFFDDEHSSIVYLNQ